MTSKAAISTFSATAADLPQPVAEALAAPRPGEAGTVDAGVNIHGHLFLGRWGDRAMFAFVVDRPEIAKPILERKG